MKGTPRSNRTYTRNLGGGRQQSANESCESLDLTDLISKPVDKVVRSLSKGQKLAVGYEGTKVVLKTLDGTLCGYIASDRNQKIIDCLKAGKNFVATVLSVQGTMCKVNIKIPVR